MRERQVHPPAGKPAPRHGGRRSHMPKRKRSASSAPTINPEFLTELALDLRWSWNHSADELWAQLDPELWALTHNPWVVLQTVSRTTLQQVLARPEYRDRVETLLRDRREYLASTARFQGSHAQAPPTGVP